MKTPSTGMGLRRDLELLEVLASATARGTNSLGVTRVAELAGREKSQVSRALRALASEGLVERDADTRGYRVGWRLFALAAQTLESRLVALAMPHLRAVVAKVQETTALCVLRGDQVLTVASESATHAFRGVGWEGISVPVAATSAGRVLVSEWDEPAIRHLFPPQTIARSGARPLITSTDGLLDELAKIRSQGYATVDEEFEYGVVGCSAPVRDPHGRIIAAVNIIAPKARLGDRLDMAGRFVAGAAAALGERLCAPDEPVP